MEFKGPGIFDCCEIRLLHKVIKSNKSFRKNEGFKVVTDLESVSPSLSVQSAHAIRAIAASTVMSEDRVLLQHETMKP